jgi:hypothetical protein
MKHLKLYSIALAAVGLLGLSACSNSDVSQSQKEEKVTFTALNGEVEVLHIRNVLQYKITRMMLQL